MPAQNTPQAKTIANRLAFWIPAIIITTAGIAYFFLARDIIFLGDDIGYYSRFVKWGGTWKGIFIAMHQHWDGYNGRMCDMLAPLSLNVASLNGRAVMHAVFAMLFFGSPLLLIRFKMNVLFFRLLLIATTALTLRWDSIWMENIALQDYMWPTGYALVLLAILFSGNPKSDSWWLWVSLPFCMAAGWMHEALGFPIATGLIAYLTAGGFWKRAGNAKRAMAIAFIMGGILTVWNKCNFQKLEGIPLHPDSIPYIFLTSGYFVVILAAVTVYVSIRHTNILRELACTPWLVWSVASIVSSGIMATVGYIGRPGWYAQIFAVLAIFDIISAINPKISSKASAAASAIMALAVPLHFLAVVDWQHKLSEETRDILSKCMESETGTVFYDYTHDPELPWYLLNKVHSFPDEDDAYYRMMMMNFYCSGRKITVLPESARAIDFSHLDKPVSIGDDIISPHPLQAKSLPYNSFSLPIDIKLFTNRGGQKKYVETAFKLESDGPIYYYYTPYDFDMGYT